MSATLLQARGLHAGYGSGEVLHGIDLHVAEGGITTLLGANGAGKTTTLRALCGMIRARGEVLLAGERIDGLATEENLRLGAYTRRDRNAVAADFERVYHYFPKLRERRQQQAGTLSGGEQQMLALGRALMLRPRLLLLDEPSFGLAPLIVQEMFAILRTINQEEKVGILLVEQNAAAALDLAHEACLMETGSVVAAGAADELRENEAVRRAYLGY